MRLSENNLFARFDFDKEGDEAKASIFTIDQEAALANKLADAAEEKATMAVDLSTPEAMQAYIMKQEYLRGQIDALTYILECSRASREQHMPEKDTNQGNLI